MEGAIRRAQRAPMMRKRILLHTYLMEAQIALDAVRSEEHLSVARQNHQESVKGLRNKQERSNDYSQLELLINMILQKKTVSQAHQTQIVHTQRADNIRLLERHNKKYASCLCFSSAHFPPLRRIRKTVIECDFFSHYKAKCVCAREHPNHELIAYAAAAW